MRTFWTVLYLMLAMLCTSKVYAFDIKKLFSGVAASQSSAVKGYAFEYEVSDGNGIGLVQAFDDGERTYFQMSQGSKTPTVYVIRGTQRIVVPLEADAPYLIVRAISDKYALVVGKKEALVRYVGGRSQETMEAETKSSALAVSPNDTAAIGPTPTASGAQKPSKPASVEGDLMTGVVLNIPFHENSITLNRRVRDDLAGRIGDMRSAKQIIVNGRPSVTEDEVTAKTRALAIRDYLVSTGLNKGLFDLRVVGQPKTGQSLGTYYSEVILVKPQVDKGVPLAQLSADWDIMEQDRTVRTVLQRWADRAGWQLAWEVDVDYPIVYAAKFVGNFEDVVKQFAESLKPGHVPVQIKLYEGNRILRVTPGKIT